MRHKTLNNYVFDSVQNTGLHSKSWNPHMRVRHFTTQNQFYINNINNINDNSNN